MGVSPTPFLDVGWETYANVTGPVSGFCCIFGEPWRSVYAYLYKTYTKRRSGTKAQTVCGWARTQTYPKRMTTYACNTRTSTASWGKRMQTHPETYPDSDPNVGGSQSLGTVASDV